MQLTDPYDPIYDGCSSSTNSSKACFGMPQVLMTFPSSSSLLLSPAV